MDKNDALRSRALQYEAQDNAVLAQRLACSDVEDARVRYSEYPPTHGFAVPPPRLPSRSTGVPRLLMLLFCLTCAVTSVMAGVLMMVLPFYDRLHHGGTPPRPKQETRVVPALTDRNLTERQAFSTSIHTLRTRIDELDAAMERDG